jgi:hypothetical protein
MATDISPATIKDALIRVVDELSPERMTELLEFALFIKARQMERPFYFDPGIEKLLSQQQADLAQSPFPLQGSVIRYDDPFAPVAEADWESLQ